MGGFFAFVAIYATDDLGLSGSGEVLLLFGLIVVVTRIAFAKLPDRVSPFRLGAVALAFCATGLGTAAVFVGVPGLLVGAALLAVGVAFTTPAIFAAIFARVPASERGAASGNREPVHRPRVRWWSNAAGNRCRLGGHPGGIPGGGPHRRGRGSWIGTAVS